MKTFISYLNEGKIESVMKTDGHGNIFWVIPNTEDDSSSYSIFGIPHREDGPAQEFNDGGIFWNLNDRKIQPTIKMMSKYIRLNPENIFKDYKWPKEIQVLAIELGGNEIKDRLIKEKKIYPSLMVKGLDKLDKRGFFN